MSEVNSENKRSKGMGRLFLRGNVWYMRYRYNGKETTKATGVAADRTDDITLAQSRERANEVLMRETEILRLQEKRQRLRIVKAMIESVEDDIRDNVTKVTRETPVSRLSEAFAKSARRIDCSEKQLEVYQRYIRKLMRHIGTDMPISAVDDVMAEQVAENLAKGHSPNTYNKYLNGLTVVWDAIGKTFGCASNPWKNLPRKRLDTNVRSILTDEEIRSIMNEAEGEMKALLSVGLYTAMRLGDCAHLKWDRIRDGVIYVKTSKTGANIAMPIHSNLAKVLDGLERDGEYVMPNMKAAYDASNSSLSRKVIALFRKCGIDTSTVQDENGRKRPRCGFHSLRHTACSRWIAAGIPSHIVQALMGHASAKMTEHYTHLKDEQFLAAFGSLA